MTKFIFKIVFYNKISKTKKANFMSYLKDVLVVIVALVVYDLLIKKMIIK